MLGRAGPRGRVRRLSPLRARPRPGTSLTALVEKVLGAVRLLILREVAVRAIALLGGLVLAALLGTSDFGVFAVGLGLLTVLQEFSSLGLGAALLRRPEPPSEAELRALVGFQLGVGVAVAAIAVALAWLVLPAAGVEAPELHAVALLLVALPLSAWRVAPRCVLERDLRYGSLSVVDLSEQLAFYTASVALAALGAELWSLPAGGIAAAIAGSAVAAGVSGVVPSPTRRLGPLSSIWRFGAKFQATQILSVVRDFGLNALLLAFAGASVVGIWALVQRMLAAPVAFFQILWRVGFVAFARVPDRREAEQHAQRVLSLTAVTTPALVASVVAVVPALVGGVLGSAWAGVDVPLLLAAAGWVLTAPIFAALQGLFQARGDLRASARALAVQIAVLWAAAVVLAPEFGAEAIGAAWLVALVVDAAIFLRLARPLARLSLAPIGTAAVVAVAVAAAGRGVAEWMPTLPGVFFSGAAALAVWFLLSLLLMRDQVRGLATVAGVAPGSLAPR